MTKNELFSAYYKELKCKIYILGCENEGESIIFILYGDKKVIYSCIVDSFVFNGEVAINNIMHECGIDKITDLFWTHPHDDHSDGIIYILEKYKPEYVFIPSELQHLPDNVGSVSKKTLDVLNRYKGYDRRFEYQPKVIGVGNNTVIRKYILKVDAKEVQFEINGVAPCAGRVRRKAIENCGNLLNDYSLAASVSVGDFSMLLTGDLQDEMINFSKHESMIHIPKPNILKIPHHGSKYSMQIMSLFEDGIIDYGVTTRKKTSKLPKQKVLDYYNGVAERLYFVDELSQELAIWGVEVDILTKVIQELECNNFILYKNNL